MSACGYALRTVCLVFGLVMMRFPLGDYPDKENIGIMPGNIRKLKME
jgi:hypothetical protein